MNSTLCEQAIATGELYSHLEQQVNAVAPEIPALVPVPIKMERVGFTRNASCTPYIVYWVGSSRCCTFVKRKVFFELGQALLKLVRGIEGKVHSVISSAERGLWVSTGEQREYIASPYVDKIFERYNQIALFADYAAG